jgi:hypothetical protein
LQITDNSRPKSEPCHAIISQTQIANSLHTL